MIAPFCRLLSIALVALAGCGNTVRPGAVGLKLQPLKHPALQEEPKPEGFYIQWPWNTIVAYDVTVQSRTEDVEVLTEEDLHLPTRATVAFHADPKRVYDLHLTIGPDYYEEVVRPAFVTLLRGEFARHAHNDLAEHSPRIEQDVLAALRQTIGDRPIVIDRVTIDHIAFDKSVTAAISAKLTAAELARQRELEVQIAQRDADIVRERARGEADAIRLKGQAQAEAQEAIGATLTPRYLQYKAFDSASTRYYFVPVGKDGMPIIVDAGGRTN